MVIFLHRIVCKNITIRAAKRRAASYSETSSSQLTYSSCRFSSSSMQSSQLSSSPVITTRFGFSSEGRGNRTSTLYLSMILRMAAPRAPIMRLWTRWSISQSMEIWSSCTLKDNKIFVKSYLLCLRFVKSNTGTTHSRKICLPTMFYSSRQTRAGFSNLRPARQYCAAREVIYILAKLMK